MLDHLIHNIKSAHTNQALNEILYIQIKTSILSDGG